MVEIDADFFEKDEFGRPLDALHRQMRANLKKLMLMSSDEFFALLVEQGITAPMAR